MERLMLFLLLLVISEEFLHAAAEDDVEIIPNQRTSIDDCHVRYHRYSLPIPSTPQVALGRRANIREFAHVAAIGWTREDGAIVWNCGGSLIWENYVLTAAHCTADVDNNVPDVARFGDIKLYDIGDDMLTQQRRIVEIIRHPEHTFSRRYHDIALMRLDTSVNLYDTVAPACLWNEDAIRFKSLEAAGWGDTGFAEKRSPVLLKVSLSPVDPARCSNHFSDTRGLRDVLHPNQMCAGDEKKGTCPGDSGGPLQVKLQHNTRITPFVVGVTSFGAACGQSVPGVYTRVAPYIPWIRTVLNDRGENATEQMFQPSACALRYVRYREYDPAVILGRINGQQSLKFSNAQLLKAATEHQVSIHWNETISMHGSTCYGSIFDERWVVTLARCTEIDGIPPTYIRYGGNKTNYVAEYFQHPRYEPNLPYNDLGLLKLKDRVTFGGSFVPACLWYKEGTAVSRLNIVGRGLRNLIERNIGAIAVVSNETTEVHAIAYERRGSSCSLSHDYTSQFEKGLTDEHLCFGSDQFLVPGTCNQSVGGPIQSVGYLWGRMLPDVHSLNLFGRDCGYGEPAVGVKIAHHTEWIQSILLPKQDLPDHDERVMVQNEAIAGDRCVLRRGGEGTCVDDWFCPDEYQFEVCKVAGFCHTGALVCCPNKFVPHYANSEWRQIEECLNKSHTLKQSFDTKQSLVSITWNTTSGVRSCVGTIIASRTIVVAANCVIGMQIPVNVYFREIYHPLSASKAVESVIVHHEFNNSTKQHNIALIQMKDRLEKQLGKSPACLWTNSTHTPFFLTQILTNISDHTNAIPRYNTDCEDTFGRVLKPNELCLDMDLQDGKLVVPEDMPALWNKTVGDESSIPVLVGIASHKSIDDSSVFLHTRISSYMSWIKSVV